MMHTTKDELDFIKNLGTFTAKGKVIGRQTLLRFYLQAMALRRNWGDMAKGIILKFAESEFDKEVSR